MRNDGSFNANRGLEILDRARLELEAIHEESARGVLGLFASAMNWLEGSAGFAAAHADLHVAGRVVRQRFPLSCRLERRANDFEQTCPVAIAHKRFGFSPRMTANAICSICATDIAVCEHRRGATYEVFAATTALNWCNVCADKHCETHEHGRRYATRANVVITEIYEIIEISLIPIPQQPDARLLALPIERTFLEQLHGGAIPDEMDVTCDACLRDCPGLDYLEPASGS